MSRLLMTRLMTGFNEVKSRVNQLSDKYHEFRFGLKLISQKRWNYYFRVFMLTSGAATTGLYISIHSLPPMMNTFKSIIQTYQGGQMKEVDEELRRFAENVFNDCNKTLNKSLGKISFFNVSGSEVVPIGSPGLPFGAFIGLPFSMIFKTKDDVKTSDIRFLGEQNTNVMWRSENGQTLLESLVLSENAKKFSIAQQIFVANSLNILVDGLNVGLMTVTGLWLPQVFLRSRKSPFWSTPLPQFLIRTIGLIFSYYLWYQTNKVLVHFANMRADEKVIALGDHYLDGGIEYYSKVKSRNAAFVHLLDPNLPKIFRLYTPEGEKKIISCLLTYEQRINYLKSLKNRLKDKNQMDLNHEK